MGTHTMTESIFVVYTFTGIFRRAKESAFLSSAFTEKAAEAVMRPEKSELVGKAFARVMAAIAVLVRAVSILLTLRVISPGHLVGGRDNISRGTHRTNLET